MADFIIDLGKEGGRDGGEIVFSGTPEKLACVNDSYTGMFFKIGAKSIELYIFEQFSLIITMEKHQT